MEFSNNPTKPVPDIHVRIASAVRQGRADRQLSLEQLSQASGVSRSMLSLIERGESSATAVVLEKIATALGVPLARLFDHPQDSASPMSRKADRESWKDPATGYQRWNVSPPGYPSPLQIVEVLFPPHARVAFETSARDAVVHQQVWVLDGRIEVSLGDTVHPLAKGDCLAMQLDTAITYHNRTDKPVRYVVVLASPLPPGTRRSA